MELQLLPTTLAEVKIVRPEVFRDHRGFFLEAYRADQFAALGLPTAFVQLNHSGSVKNVLRGLHFQWEPPMGKLMRVTRGDAFLVAVDIRPGSPTLGRWTGIEASADNCLQVWAPAGFARGFCVLSEYAEIQYLTTGVYNSSGEGQIAWDDPEIGIKWPLAEPIISAKDRAAPTLRQWLASSQAKRGQI